MKKNKNQTTAEAVFDSFVKGEKLLDEREKSILTKYYGFGTNMRHTLDEIAKVYGISKERVRQIKHYAVEKITSNTNEKQKHGTKVNN